MPAENSAFEAVYAEAKRRIGNRLEEDALQGAVLRTLEEGAEVTVELLVKYADNWRRSEQRRTRRDAPVLDDSLSAIPPVGRMARALTDYTAGPEVPTHRLLHLNTEERQAHDDLALGQAMDRLEQEDIQVATLVGDLAHGYTEDDLVYRHDLPRSEIKKLLAAGRQRLKELLIEAGLGPRTPRVLRVTELTAPAVPAEPSPKQEPRRIKLGAGKDPRVFRQLAERLALIRAYWLADAYDDVPPAPPAPVPFTTKSRPVIDQAEPVTFEDPITPEATVAQRREALAPGASQEICAPTENALALAELAREWRTKNGLPLLSWEEA